jgi:glyoxylase-like metal-dependent hydrolase (beta-lactamase superfamily II)
MGVIMPHKYKLPDPKYVVVSVALLFSLGRPALAAEAASQVPQGDYFHTGAGARYLQRAKEDLVVQPLRGNIAVLMGSGGNVTVFESREGKFLVDAGISPSKEKIEAVLKKLGPEPLKYVVNTHWHWDHTDGNAWMHAAGATIIAQENTHRHLTQTTRIDDWNWTFEPVATAARPTLLVKSSKTIRFGGDQIDIEHYGLGHTDGDLAIYFKNQDVLALGDTFWNGYYPFIDNEHGGSINNAIQWANAAIEHCTDKTILVPGHGPVGTRAQLIAFRDMLVSVRDNVAALKRQGKSLDEIIAARPTAAFDDKWARFVIGPAFFTKLVYDGL